MRRGVAGLLRILASGLFLLGGAITWSSPSAAYALATEGAILADVTRMTTFVTDMRDGMRESAKPYQDYVSCRKEALGNGPVPAARPFRLPDLLHPTC